MIYFTTGADKYTMTKKLEELLNLPESKEVIKQEEKKRTS